MLSLIYGGSYAEKYCIMYNYVSAVLYMCVQSKTSVPVAFMHNPRFPPLLTFISMQLLHSLNFTRNVTVHLINNGAEMLEFQDGHVDTFLQNDP